MTRSNFRGHPTIYLGDEKWIYEDTGEPAGFRNVRPCKKCGKVFEGSNIGESDPCLQDLPGVDNACCGHGVPEDAYVRFISGVVIRGFTEIEYTERFEAATNTHIYHCFICGCKLKEVQPAGMLQCICGEVFLPTVNSEGNAVLENIEITNVDK